MAGVVERLKRLASYAITTGQATAYTAPVAARSYNEEATAKFRLMLANGSGAARTVSIWIGPSGTLTLVMDTYAIAANVAPVILDIDFLLGGGEIVQAIASGTGCVLYLFGVERTRD